MPLKLASELAGVTSVSMSPESTEPLRADLESSDPLRVSNIKARPTHYTRTAGFSQNGRQLSLIRYRLRYHYLYSKNGIGNAVIGSVFTTSTTLPLNDH
jgi:hypothetical protein